MTPLAAGQAGRATIECEGVLEPLSFTVEFYDPAIPPARLEGAGPGALKLRPRATTRYVADVVPSSGSIRVGIGARATQSFASRGTYELGMLPGGVEQRLTVSTPGETSGWWTIVVRPLPVALSDLSLDRAVYRPPDPIAVRFTTGGDTEVSARVLTPAGALARFRWNGPRKVGPGTHTLVGMGFNGGGPPDGANRLVLSARDPSGLKSSIETAITFDRTAPAVELLSPSRLPAPGTQFRARVHDATSGLDQATLRIDDRPVASGASLAYRPRRGWVPGTHRWAVEANDVAGNEVYRQGRFVTPLGNITRSCRPVRAIHRIRARRLACPQARLTLAAWSSAAPPGDACDVRADMQTKRHTGRRRAGR